MQPPRRSPRSTCRYRLWPSPATQLRRRVLADDSQFSPGTVLSDRWRLELFSLFLLASPWVVRSAEPQAPDVRMIRDEAEAALGILTRPRSAAPGPADWSRLFQSEGYRRLARREASMGRPMSDSAFQSFLLSDTMAARGPAPTGTKASRCSPPRADPGRIRTR